MSNADKIRHGRVGLNDMPTSAVIVGLPITDFVNMGQPHLTPQNSSTLSASLYHTS